VVLEPVYDRPADKLGQGKWAGSPFLILGIGGVTLALGILFVVLRVRSALRARRGADQGPISSRRPQSMRPPPSR
jgi:hypothetical protein